MAWLNFYWFPLFLSKKWFFNVEISVELIEQARLYFYLGLCILQYNIKTGQYPLSNKVLWHASVHPEEIEIIPLPC